MFGDKAIRFFWIPFVLFFAFWALKVWFFSLNTGYGTGGIEKAVLGGVVALSAIYRFLMDIFEKRNLGAHRALDNFLPYFSSFVFSFIFNLFVVFILMEQELY